MNAVKLVKQGAEGRLYIGKLKDEVCIVKERFIKKYRHPELDSQITRQRMKAESRAVVRCQEAGILVPKILLVDLNKKQMYMQYFQNAITAKEFIKKVVTTAADNAVEFSKLELLCDRIGTIVGKLHQNNIIHGDLTTSNLLIDSTDGDFKEYKVILIDFGLSSYNKSAEDKSVDLYVLERALLSTHSEQAYMFEKILKAYREQNSTDQQSVLSRFEEVRIRGRKRPMLG